MGIPETYFKLSASAERLLSSNSSYFGALEHGERRMLQSWFEKSAAKQVYEAEGILGLRMNQGFTEAQVRERAEALLADFKDIPSVEERIHEAAEILIETLRAN